MSGVCFFDFFFLLLVELDGMSFNGCVIHTFGLSLVMRIVWFFSFKFKVQAVNVVHNNILCLWWYLLCHIYKIEHTERGTLNDGNFEMWWSARSDVTKYLSRFMEQFKNIFIGEYSKCIDLLHWWWTVCIPVWYITSLRHINNLIDAMCGSIIEEV